MALTDVVAVLQAHAASLSGIQSAPADPTESIGQVPAAITFVVEMEVDSGASGPGSVTYLVTFHTMIFKSRSNLPTDVAALTPYGDSFPAAVMADPLLLDANGVPTVQTVNQPLKGTFGVVRYAGSEYIGWTFATNVTYYAAVTVVT